MRQANRNATCQAIALLLVLSAGGWWARAEDAFSPAAVWYEGETHAWNRPLGWRHLYAQLLAGMGAAQREAKKGLAPEDVIPIDCRVGVAKPRISYILAHPTARTIGRYSAFPGLEHLDLYYATDLDHDAITALSTSRVHFLALPAKGAPQVASPQARTVRALRL